jgi:diguanylate cyclase (GGDEF)-like protein
MDFDHTLLLAFGLPALAAIVAACVAVRRGRRLDAHRDALTELARTLSADGAARGHLCAAAARIADGAFAYLAEPAPSGDRLIVTATADLELAGHELPFGEPSATVAAFRSGRTIHLADLSAAGTDVSPALARHTGAVAARFKPVRDGDVIVGVLVIGWRHLLDEVPDETVELLQLLAAQASEAIKRDRRVTRLVRQARTDALTGLPNRRSWDELLEREVARARRTGAPVCVAMLDLDRFKAFNDAHGHQAGDDLLSSAARAWRAQLRRQDVLVRYGGEEFALLLPDTRMDTALDVVDRVRDATPKGVTASAGVVELGAGEGCASVVARADAALYRAKHAGRAATVAA